ncbi:MAG: hypothetical protein NZ937_08805 [Armatimonadetes bacterium]|nr:hypothetical protein [Armatimonadota bacterium]
MIFCKDEFQPIHATGFSQWLMTKQNERRIYSAMKFSPIEIGAQGWRQRLRT